jgi:hypothetical protein
LIEVFLIDPKIRKFNYLRSKKKERRKKKEDEIDLSIISFIGKTCMDVYIWWSKIPIRNI